MVAPCKLFNIIATAFSLAAAVPPGDRQATTDNNDGLNLTSGRNVLMNVTSKFDRIELAAFSDMLLKNTPQSATNALNKREDDGRVGWMDWRQEERDVALKALMLSFDRDMTADRIDYKVMEAQWDIFCALPGTQPYMQKYPSETVAEWIRAKSSSGRGFNWILYAVKCYLNAGDNPAIHLVSTLCEDMNVDF